MIIINFKNYKAGKDVLALAKRIEKFSPKAICSVPTINIAEISKNTKLKLIAEHADSYWGERGTGYIVIESLKKEGVIGSLINHSEHKIKIEEIKNLIQRLKINKMKSIVCAGDIDSAWIIKSLNPDHIAFEDPDLIASGKSITSYNPQGVRDFVEMMKGSKSIPICGAGISTIDDVKEAIKLGCKGVLISSAIANSKNPDKILKEISKFC